MRNWLYGTVLVGCVISGCAHGRRGVAVEYTASASLATPVRVKRGGDFALYFDGNLKPEIPIRLDGGEPLGFERAKDGRVQAVAGQFRMNLSADVERAYWKRLNTRED